MHALWSLTGSSLLAWIGLLVGRGFFWWPSPRLDPPKRRPQSACAAARSVVAVIPARNEADILPRTLPTVLTQHYCGPFRVVLVDDRSDDGTATVARTAAEALSAGDRLEVHTGKPLATGWSGKVWAMHQGASAAVTISHAAATATSQVGRPPTEQPEYLWFTDADIAHEPWVLSALVDRAEAGGLDLVSTMATLKVDSVWDSLLVPAFVYFFAKLYPFRFVCNPHRRHAGAAGGCVLVRRSALDQAGGLASIRSALIDDCALGRLIKRVGGRLWLGFSRGVYSVRSYGNLASIWGMVARSAYTQLGHSPLKLVGTILGMLFLYALAPAACIGGAMAAAHGVPGARLLSAIGATTWGLMAASFIPQLRHHRVKWWIAPLLPVAGVLYTVMTVSSAWRHIRGRGGAWKGRTY
jgi:hopene-associated glycosyltransferase HpnB